MSGVFHDNVFADGKQTWGYVARGTVVDGDGIEHLLVQAGHCRWLDPDSTESLACNTHVTYR